MRGIRFDIGHEVTIDCLQAQNEGYDLDFLTRMRSLAETELGSERLTLEPLVPDHAAVLFSRLSSPALYAFIPQDPPPDTDWLENRFSRIAKRGPVDRSAVWLNWALRRRDGDYCGLFEATARADGGIDIAYFVFAPDQRQGFGREAAQTVITALWRDPDTRVIGASLDTRNRASSALLEAVGFVRVGVQRHADFFDGAPSDEYRYELARHRPLLDNL